MVPDRLCKHVYDPELHFGSAPQACNEKMSSAILYASQGKFTEAYQELGRAAHYLMDVCNPYHSNLANTDKIKHDFYERYVEDKIGEWNLALEASQAPKIPVTNPKDAVKSLREGFETGNH